MNLDTALPEGITGWELRIVWPIVDDSMFCNEAIAAARRYLRDTATWLEAIVVGEPTFWIDDAKPTDPGVDTPTVVRCVVPAVPAWQHWQAIVAELAGRGWSDPRIAALLLVKVERVRALRRRHSIPSGVPRGWTAVNAERWAAA